MPTKDEQKDKQQDHGHNGDHGQGDEHGHQGDHGNHGRPVTPPRTHAATETIIRKQ